MVDDKNRITDDRIRLKVIGYSLMPTRKFIKTRDVGKAFGLSYRGGCKVVDAFNDLVNRKLIENYSEGKTIKLYFIRNRKGLEELYNEILWRNV